MLAKCPPCDEIVAYCIGARPDMLPEEAWTKIRGASRFVLALRGCRPTRRRDQLGALAQTAAASSAANALPTPGSRVAQVARPRPGRSWRERAQRVPAPRGCAIGTVADCHRRIPHHRQVG